MNYCYLAIQISYNKIYNHKYLSDINFTVQLQHITVHHLS
jgi:hypothetical protein